MNVTRQWLGSLSRASLQVKFLLISLPLIALITTALFTYIHFAAAENDRRALEDRINKVAEIEAVSLAGLVWGFNRPQIELFMSAIVNDPDITGAQVLDESGQVLGEAGIKEPDNMTLFLRSRDIGYRESQKGPERLIGELRLIYSIERVQQAADQRLLTNVLTVALLTLAIMLSALAALHLAVKRPLDRFLAIIQDDQIEHSGRGYDPEVPQGKDEVATVVRAYDELQSQQKTYEQELRSVRDGLEIAVEKRTKDLRLARDRAQNALSDLQNMQARLVQSEKMASLGQLTAGIAHEIKNPLNFVNNFASVSGELIEELVVAIKDPMNSLSAEDREDAEDLVQTLLSNLEKINEHGQRADSIVKNMLAHSRQDQGQRSRFDINALTEEAIGLVYHGARAETPEFNINIEKLLGEEIPEIEGFSQDILRVLINTMSNGMYAAYQRHRAHPSDIEPKISIKTSVEGASVRIDITDNGSGIPKSKLEKIFTPFYTTKPPGEGTGLGLSLSFDIVVTQHGGQMLVESKPDVATTFSVLLPIDGPLDVPAAGVAN
jgi:signal transduction histidine kinase